MIPAEEGSGVTFGAWSRRRVSNVASAFAVQARSHAPGPVLRNSISGSSSLPPQVVPAPSQYQLPGVSGLTRWSGAASVPPRTVDISSPSWTTNDWLTSCVVVGRVGGVMGGSGVSENIHSCRPSWSRAEYVLSPPVQPSPELPYAVNFAFRPVLGAAPATVGVVVPGHASAAAAVPGAARATAPTSVAARAARRRFLEQIIPLLRSGSDLMTIWDASRRAEARE